MILILRKRGYGSSRPRLWSRLTQRKFGAAPESVKQAVDALAAGQLDNLPLTTDNKIDVVAWNESRERSE